MVDNGRPRGRGRPRTFEDDDAFRVTTQLLLEGGIGHLTLQRVAQRLESTHQALGQRFSSRDGLLIAYLEWLSIIVSEDIQAIKRESSSPLEIARKLWILPINPRVVGTMDEDKQAVWALLGLELRREPILKQRMQPRSPNGDPTFRILVEEAQQCGELDSATPATDIAEAVLVAVTGAAIQWTITPDEDLVQKMVRCRERALAPYLSRPGK